MYGLRTVEEMGRVSSSVSSRGMFRRHTDKSVSRNSPLIQQRSSYQIICQLWVRVISTNIFMFLLSPSKQM